MIATLTSGQLAAIRATVASMIFLVELDLDSSTYYLTSAIRDVKWGGQTWLGMGRIATVDVISEKTSLESVAVRIGITGVPTSWRSLALQEPIRGRDASVFVGLVDSDEQPIGDMLLEYKGRLDAPSIVTSKPDSDGNRTATISVTVEGIMVDWARGGRARRHTNEDQQELYPGDDIYSLADEISVAVLPWGIPK